MNFDDPVEPPPHLFRFINLRCFDAPPELDMMPEYPLTWGCAPGYPCVSASRSLFLFCLPLISLGNRPRRGQISVAQGAALGKRVGNKLSSVGAIQFFITIEYKTVYSKFFAHSASVAVLW